MYPNAALNDRHHRHRNAKHRDLVEETASFWCARCAVDTVGIAYPLMVHGIVCRFFAGTNLGRRS
jgi:hypothetical protein